MLHVTPRIRRRATRPGRRRCAMPNVRFSLPVLMGTIFAALLLAACGGGPGSGKPKVEDNPRWDAAGAPLAGPLAVFRELEVDFGKVPLNEWIEYQYTLKNAGDAPLQVLGEPAVAVLDGC